MTLLAFAVRLINLQGQSLWVDEGITFARATLPWRDVFNNLLLVGNQTPVYYVLLRLWLAVVGTSEFVLRFPSVWTASLTVPLVYIGGKVTFGNLVGLTAAGLLALNPFHIWYAQEARMYALGTLMAAFVLVAFVRALRRPGWGGWMVLALVSGLAYVVHYFTLTLGAVQFVVFVCRMRHLYLRFRRWAVAQVLAVIPVFVWMSISMTKRGTTRLGGNWIPRPSCLAPLYTFFNFSVGYESDPSALIVLGWGLYLMAFCWAFWHRGERNWWLTLVAWIGLPVLVTFFISLRRPYYVDRYLTIVLPGFLVWIALGVMRLPHRWRYIVVMTLLTVSALAVGDTLSGVRYRKEDWRAAVAKVHEQAQIGDQLLVAGAEDVPVSKYYLGDAVPLSVGLPEVFPDGRVWFLYRIPIESNHRLGEPVEFDLDTQADVAVRDWLIAYNEQIVGEWRYPGLALFLVEG